MELELIYSPEWFFGKDIVIDIVSIVALVLISFFALRCYGINKKNTNYLYLALSFGVLALSFISKILANFAIHKEITQTKEGFLLITQQTIHFYPKFFAWTVGTYIFFTLIGLFMLYNVYRKQSITTTILITYFILLISQVSFKTHIIFHLSAFILMLLIILEYYDNYKQNKGACTKLVMLSFITISISYLMFILVKINNVFYVVAELVQLIGYIGLLSAFIMVIKNGKKKNKN